MTAASLSRRLLILEATAADARGVELSVADFLAGRLARGWSLYKAIRASYGYDPEEPEPIGPQLETVWQGAAT